MSYSISYSDKFDKSLDKIDNANAQKILTGDLQYRIVYLFLVP
jgi:mRNA-degrading endonuclease RelE of RelBE toxin-antitoxin system